MKSPCIFPVDAPDLGGFISSTTIVSGNLWRMGQLKSGDTIQYRRVSLEDALRIRTRLEKFLTDVAALVTGQCKPETISPAFPPALPDSTQSGDWGKACILSTTVKGSTDAITFRQVQLISEWPLNSLLMITFRVAMISCWWNLETEIST